MMKTWILFSLVSLLILGCNSKVSEFAEVPSAGDYNKRPEPTPAGPPGGGTGGDCVDDPTIGRTCTSDGEDVFGDGSGVITTELLNFNGGQNIRGGGSYEIKFRSTTTFVKFKSFYSKLEYKRDGDSVWYVIADNVVHNDAELVSVPWEVCPIPTRSDCLESQVGNSSDYKVRITTRRLADQSAEATSVSSFTIDSESPVLAAYSASPDKGFSIVSSDRNGGAKGFITFKIMGATDNLSLVDRVCIKTGNLTSEVAPDRMDGCWIPVDMLKPTRTSTMIDVTTLPLFWGLAAVNATKAHLWISDKAGNTSSMVYNGSGTFPIGVENQDVLAVPALSAISQGTTAALTPPTWSPALSGSTTPVLITAAGGTVPKFLYDDLSQVPDHQSLIVAPSGKAYVKHGIQGLLEIDMYTAAATRLIIKDTTHATTSSSERLREPMRMTLDNQGRVLILDRLNDADSAVISRLNLRTFGINTSVQMADIIGGGTQTTDADKAANQIKITWNEGLKLFSTLVALPDGSIVFSADSTTALLGTFKLRKYDPSRLTNSQVSTITLSVLDSDGVAIQSPGGNLLSTFEPYSNVAVSFDSNKEEISKLYLRGCSGYGTSPSRECNEIVMMEFDGTGQFVRFLPEAAAWQWGASALQIDAFGRLLMVNSKAGYVGRLDVKNSSAQWTSIFSEDGRGSGYCDNGSFAGLCRVRVSDVTVTQSGILFFVDNDKIRFVDLDGAIKTLTAF
jgi:hypothetical protein